MNVLLLRLAAPLQSWGDSSRFSRRQTRAEPTRSGILGLLAAAQGRRRTDPIEDLVGLRVGVRTDQPGRLVRDFQTARSLDGQRTMPLSYRYYLGDAVFLAAVAGDGELIAGLADALRRPTFPLYLGRRSCPPAGPLLPELRPGTLAQTLRDEPWRAAAWWQRRNEAPTAELEILRDAVGPGEVGERGELVRDDPVSFDPRRREYTWRTVVREQTTVANPHGRGRRPSGESGDGHVPGAAPLPSHDPMAAL